MSFMALVVLAAGALQEADAPNLEERVARYLQGDDAQRSHILAEAAKAMYFLRPHRGKARADALIREVRSAAAAPANRKTGELLAGAKYAYPDEDKMTLDVAMSAVITDDLRFSFDPQAYEALAQRKVSMPKAGTALEVLESLCVQAETDFAFLYGIVLVASPERLWPHPSPRNRPLTEEERARAQALLPKLGAEAFNDRDRATADLRKFGPPVIPVLEAGATHRDPEISSRCRDLIAELKPKPTRLFGTPSVEKQKLEGADADLYASLRQKEITFKVKDLNTPICLKLLLSQIGDFSLLGEIPNHKISGAFESHPLAVILAVITQSSNLDYVIEGGKLVVGPREEIRGRVTGK